MFLGIDLHTNRFTCCYLDEQGNKEFKTFELNEQQLALFYETLSMDTHVLLEATINSFMFISLIKEKVNQVIIANTYQLKLISMERKGDELRTQIKVSAVPFLGDIDTLTSMRGL